MNEAAFERPEEARLVDALRDVARTWISLVAVEDGAVVGHVLFTEVSVRPEEASASAWPAVALAPLAVLPSRQRRGIGSALARAGLEACRAAGHGVVFVLGNPAYYGRFGFVPAAPKGLRYGPPALEPAFQVAETEAGALRGRTGRVAYLPPFDAV